MLAQQIWCHLGKQHLLSLLSFKALLATLLKKVLTMKSGQFFTAVSSESWHSSVALQITWYHYHCFDSCNGKDTLFFTLISPCQKLLFIRQQQHAYTYSPQLVPSPLCLQLVQQLPMDLKIQLHMLLVTFTFWKNYSAGSFKFFLF